MKGETGPTGSPGATGSTGATGATGATGTAPVYNEDGTPGGTAHVVQGSGTAAGRKLTVKFTGAAGFTSNTSYLCSGYDETKKVPILGIAYTSGSEVTFEYFTGAGTDTIRYQCTGT